MGAHSKIGKAVNKIDQNLLYEIARQQGLVDTRYQQNIYPVYAYGDRRRRPVLWIERDMAQQLYDSGDFKSVRSGYVLTYKSERQLLKGQWRYGQAGQMPTETKTIYVPQNVQRQVSRKIGGNILNRLAKILDKSGHPFLSKSEVQAGELFQRDYQRAYGHLGSGQSFNQPQVDQSKVNNTEIYMAEQIDRSAAFLAAKEALGEGLDIAAMVLCGENKSLSQLEREQNWAKNSGQTIVKLALQRLVVYYGAQPGEYSKRL